MIDAKVKNNSRTIAQRLKFPIKNNLQNYENVTMNPLDNRDDL